MVNITLKQALTPDHVADGHDQYFIPENWLQGRSCYGGLSAAIGLQSLRHLTESKRPLRSLQVIFSGPLSAGSVTVRASVLRTGKNVECLTSQVMSGESVGTQVTGVFGDSRDSLSLPLPFRDDLPDLRNLQTAPFVKGVMPDFLENFEVKWLGDGVPFSGSKENTIHLWARFKDTKDLSRELMYIALADTHPSAILSHFKHPVAQSSVSWSLEVLRPLEKAAGEWMFIDAGLDMAANGYCVQTTNFYDESGALMMMGRQNMVYFG